MVEALSGVWARGGGHRGTPTLQEVPALGGDTSDGGPAAHRTWPGGCPLAASRLGRSSVGWWGVRGHLNPEALPRGQSPPAPCSALLPGHPEASQFNSWAGGAADPSGPWMEQLRQPLQSCPGCVPRLVVGPEQGGHLLEDGLVVGVQRDALVHHLPPDGHARIAGVQVL